MKINFSIALSSRVNVALLLLLCSELDCLQAKYGRIKEFEAVLQLLRGEDADISQEAADIIVIPNFIILYKGATNIELLLVKSSLIPKPQIIIILLTFIVLQEYTENIHWISEDGILYLFHRKYAYSILVSTLNYS
jgi:hypothetical protein